MGLVCQNQGFGLLLSPEWGLGRGAQSPGQSHLVLSQASGARHLRGSDRRAWDPALRHQKARAVRQEAGGPELECRPEEAGRDRTQPCLQQA